MKDLLYKKFTNVPTRPGRGGTYPYIRWQDIADRMNQVFGIQWSSEVVYQDIVGSNVVTRIRVTVLDATTGNTFFQEGFGGATIDDRQEAGTPFKAAYSKALKDACKKWGVGLYIDEDAAEQGIVPFPASNTNIKTPVVPTTTAIPTVPVAQVVVEAVVVPPTVPTSKKVKSTIPPIPVENSTSQVASTIPIQQINPAVVPIIPPLPGVDAGNVVVTKTNVGQTTISDVQMAALQSIISIQGVEYDQLVQDAFESKGVALSNGIPAMETLSYKDAVMVVKYGNDRFRKH